MPDASIEVIEYRQGNSFNTLKLPGRVKFSNITLRRGVTQDNELYNWWKQTRDGNLQRRSGSVILLDETRQEVKRWNFFEAWPVRYKFPDLNAEGNQEAIEVIELAVESIELA